MRRLAGIELGEDSIPDESTILRFRHLLEEHELTKATFAGTIVDATIISAPRSTNNQSRSRDPEMRQTKKGNTWHFGMKVHVGRDKRGIVHSLSTTDPAQADVNNFPT